MDVLEAINKRRSIRAYLNTSIENDKLNRALEAGRLKGEECYFIDIKGKKAIL